MMPDMVFNIESWYEMKKLVVIKNRCPQNHPCPSIRICPEGALKQQGYNAPEVDNEICIKCAKCVKYCPMGALQMQEE